MIYINPKSQSNNLEWPYTDFLSQRDAHVTWRKF